MTVTGRMTSISHRVLTFRVFTQVPNDIATRSVQVSSLNLSPLTYIVHSHVTAIKCYDTLEEPPSLDLRCCFLTSSTSSISTSKPRGDMPLHVPIGILDSIPPFLVRGRDMVLAIRRGGMCGVSTNPTQTKTKFPVSLNHLFTGSLKWMRRTGCSTS